MDRERLQRIRRIFERASELPAADRDAFLAVACGDDAEIRAEVDRLLAGVSEAEAPTEAGGIVAGDGSEPAAGRRIGPYRLLRKIGEGGMGLVFEAEQERPVRRRVALKVIKHGLEGSRVLERFDVERQALAVMNHPNVARVLDAGSDEHGRPYFVMEYIAGDTITKYCDGNNLSAKARLALMIEVCDGVQHAHQKGIIHRDLKPSNILIEIRDGKAVPRIIDFGVAKAIDQTLTERSLFTEFGQVVGTPEYMSPEQAEMTGVDIDTRTDVYSLGVVLYELLVGALPFDSRELRRAGIDGMRRQIREVTPHKPSSRLESLGADSGEIAKHRSVDPSTLVRECRGDLDWITMKALEKDRTRRYGSASEFSADLKRHLANEPVSAGPPSVGYKARKFVRRHRIGVAFAAILTCAVLGGLVGTTYGLVRALRAEARTRLEAENVSAVNRFMFDMFTINDPSEARGRSITAKEVLDRGAVRIEGDMVEQPELQGRLMDSMGTVYRSLGLYGDSETQLAGAIRAFERARGADDLEVARVLTTYAGLLILRGKASEALVELRRALVIQQDRLDPFDLELARTLNNFGSAHRALKQFAEAIPYLERALVIRERVLGPDDPDVAKQLSNLGSTRLATGDMAGARRDLERALDIRERRLDPDHPDVAKTLDGLATLYREIGELDKARTTLERVIAIEEKNLGPDHPGLLNTLLNFGAVERWRGELQESERHLARALAIAEAKLGAENPQTVAVRTELDATRYQLAAARAREAGDFQAAKAALEQALALAGRLPEGHIEQVGTLIDLGVVERERGDLAASERHLARALALAEGKLRAGHALTARARLELEATRGRSS